MVDSCALAMEKPVSLSPSRRRREKLFRVGQFCIRIVLVVQCSCGGGSSSGAVGASGGVFEGFASGVSG
jgi:hypothetical protein